MTTATSAEAPSAVSPAVLPWRKAQLRAAGYPPPEAAELARSADVDLHVAVDLLRRGCPVEVALRILL